VTRPTWDEFFVGIVDAYAQRATCERGMSAAVFTRDNDMISAGYVGAPPGQPSCDEVGHLWAGPGVIIVHGMAPERHCVRTIHAEQNAILRAARIGVSLRGATLYCTMEPCRNCFMSLIGLDVKRIVCKNAYHAAPRWLYSQANIDVEVLSSAQLY
jgi:dCMP deaminase